MAFNENTRVKIPAILHLVRLGYQYISLKNAVWDTNTNIFNEIFEVSIRNINPTVTPDEIKRLREEISLLLNYEDLGKAFYERLTSSSGLKLIDWDEKTFATANSFHVVTELPCVSGDDEFRPDITLLINGLPLAFIEVKKPNNREGILQERERMDRRFSNPKFRRLINSLQLLVFSNNMEYDEHTVEPLQGAFYGTTAQQQAHFNYFREEESLDLTALLKPEDDATENFVLKDTNNPAIKYNEEFKTAKHYHSPTNRILTSLCTPARLRTMLRYGIAYVKTEDGLEKHIMRYPQLFATKAIEQSLEEGKRKGIIWHTQGSGKTALAFYNVQYLTDYYGKKGIIPKFYFIVDRLDLAIQATREFTSRGLIVREVSSKEDFAREMKQQGALSNQQGRPEITVVNIQKFSEDSGAVPPADYNIGVQRIYFLDEVHRSYKPTGSFLVNLVRSDADAIIIGLTGTPLIGKAGFSTDLFGTYIHKYYYNQSIADGYTLRLIREGIVTSYRMELERILDEIKVLKGDITASEIYAHPKFAAAMLKYIVEDFERSRLTTGENSIGAMVVCDTADQAKKMFALFSEKYVPQAAKNYEIGNALQSMAAEDAGDYDSGEKSKRKIKTAALILHDVDTKDDRKYRITEFKKGHIDLLFVYNMLLTGFDAHRLKKLYLCRVVRTHNLLQTLTRVNRPYKNFRFGYVVDFADIRTEFDATNRAYFDELKNEVGDELRYYSDIFKGPEEIEEEIREIKEALFHFNTLNATIFGQQMEQIESRAELLRIKNSLESARSLFNIIRYQGHDELLAKMDFSKMVLLLREAAAQLDKLNYRESLATGAETTNLLNVALEDIIFQFQKVSEDELVLADELKATLRRTRETLLANFDPGDPEFISLKEELERLFRKKNLDEITQDEMKDNIGALTGIYDKITELNRRNALYKAKYDNDEKYARLHKRLHERGNISKRESAIFEALKGVKEDTDEQFLRNSGVLSTEAYLQQMLNNIVLTNFEDRAGLTIDSATTSYITNLIAAEYRADLQTGNRYLWALTTNRKQNNL